VRICKCVVRPSLSETPSCAKPLGRMEYLPTEEELIKEILRQKEIFHLWQNNEIQI